MSGRAILADEDGETWITGVAPVGFSGGGVDRTAAFVDFRRGWAEILFDIAAESASFADFEARCEEFLSSSHDELATEWEAVLAEIRTKRYRDPKLPSVPADEHPVSFDVVELDPPSSAADENQVEVGLEVAA